MADMPLCFAIMPISMPPERLDGYHGRGDHFLQVSEHLFQPAAEAAGYRFRASLAMHAEIIHAGIIENLWQADMVLCDISTLNANVFYEFGIRCALNKPVAMVKDDKTSLIPFDAVMVSCHTYNADLSIMTVKKEIPRLTAFLEAAKPQTQNTVWKHFGIQHDADRPEPQNPGDAKLDLILAEVAALRRQPSPTKPAPHIDPIQKQLVDGISTVLGKMVEHDDKLEIKVADGAIEVATTHELPRRTIDHISELVHGIDTTLAGANHIKYRTWGSPTPYRVAVLSQLTS